MKQRGLHHPPHLQGRFAERVHDPYKTRLKLHDPTVCPDCGALYHKGRWSWPAKPPPADARHEICQACHRIRDDYPAGWVTLSGAFLATHKDEIVHLVRHVEKRERDEHPLHRIMAIREANGEMVITTTDIHVPRRIGEALQSAYQGTLDYHFEEGEYRLRVLWTRNGGE
jgi:hypothetical protein